MSEHDTDGRNKNRTTVMRLQTGGDLFRSATDILDPLVDEARFRFDQPADDDEDDEATLSTQAVDPANVGMVSLSVPVESFDSYQYEADSGEVVSGIPLSDLTNITDYAHKGRGADDPGDPVTLRQTAGRRLYVEVTPEDRLNRRSSLWTIDPDSLRQEPDLPNLSLPWEGQIDIGNVRDALAQAKKRFDYAVLSTDTTDRTSPSGNALAHLSIYSQETDEGGEIRKEDGFRTEEPVLENIGSTSTAVQSLYSLDYLYPMLDALKSAGVETAVLRLGDEFPLRVNFAESRFGIDGEYLLAPRIADDEDNPEQSPSWGEW
jgi:proliferating cell nuclear antigen